MVYGQNHVEFQDGDRASPSRKRLYLQGRCHVFSVVWFFNQLLRFQSEKKQQGWQKEKKNSSQEKHLHNRYLDYADKDGDGEIDTDFSKSKDRHYNTTPILSPKRSPFSPALFPGSETLHFVNDIHLLQTSRPKLALLTSPQWNGHRINPASFSAPPGLKNQAPLGSTIQGPLKIVPFLASTRRRQQLQKHSKWENETKWKTKYRKHRTDFQKDKSAAIRDGLKDQTYRRSWTGPSDHFYHGFLARHHHGCYGDSSNGKQIE